MVSLIILFDRWGWKWQLGGMPKHADRTKPAYQLLDDAGVPTAPAVCQIEKEERIPSGWMEIVKAAAEGRVVPLLDIHRWSGIPINELRATAAKEGWRTPTRVKGAAIKKVDEILNGLVEGIDPESELDLRHYEETPKKFRPKDAELLPNDESPEQARERTMRLVAALDEVRGDVKAELSRRADLHQLAVSEITQVALVNFMDKVQQDPMLGVLYAKQLESLTKTARANLKLDESKDPTAGARTVVIMSEPGFIPRPAISQTVDAETVEETDPDPDFEPVAGTITQPEEEDEIIH